MLPQCLRKDHNSAIITFDVIFAGGGLVFIKRHAGETVTKLAEMFGAVLVTGARQVGKTTLLREMTRQISYITLDDPVQLAVARDSGRTFLNQNPPPVFIDEIQYAPTLFPYIKMILDSERKKGQFFLAGSQQFSMMKNVSESLAGRLGILNLPSLSLREIKGVTYTEPFIPVEDYLRNRAEDTAEISYDDAWHACHRGFMPELWANPEYDWGLFYGSYIRTYIERDVRDLTQVGNELQFVRFMTAVAGRTGQLLNQASLAREVGISQPTAERWLSILVASNLVYLLPPYHNNIIKRAIKTPKLYFLDTGLAAYLTRWLNADVLRSGAMAGAMFETFVVAEILKSYSNKGILDLPLYFYRDRDGREIDLLIAAGDHLHPIEIKSNADPNLRDISAFALLDKLPGVIRGSGGVVCLYDKLMTLPSGDAIIPVNML